jgi:C4-dicarboxylate-specific signal transduction histidine kinase
MISAISDDLSPENFQSLLLQFKYQTAIRRVAKGVAHNYNNIFTGLSGQTAILLQESGLSCDMDCNPGELIDDLLKRGIDQTAILYDFARDMDTVKRSHSPLFLATKTLELLNSISPMHRFVLKSELRQEKVVCSLRDLVLILFYLGENCVDATPEGGKISLEIIRMQDSESAEPRFAFCFRDHGPGFAESILSALYAPFATTKCDSPHRGLGLYAADILARRYHGRLIIDRDRDREETVVSAVFPVNTEEAVERTRTEQPRTDKHDGNGLEKQSPDTFHSQSAGKSDTGYPCIKPER